MELLDFLRNAWFVLIGVLLLGYTILDGFDLGVGVLMPVLGRDENEKGRLIDSVWPFWDGNEVWLLTAGGALFAAFPDAYATAFSGMYLALMLVLFALILRAVSLEFWYYDEKRKKLWEWAFVLGSFLPALLFGVALGNMIVGIPINENLEFTGSFFTLLRPYPLVIGLLGFVTFLLHGSTYIALKTDGPLQERAKKMSGILWFVFIVVLALSLAAAIVYVPGSMKNIAPWFPMGIVVLSWLGYKIMVFKERFGLSFLMSSLMLAGLWGIAGTALYPNLIKDVHYHNSISIFNGSSSELTLKVMFLFAVIGMPIVIGYNIYIYRVFKGKIRN